MLPPNPQDEYDGQAVLLNPDQAAVLEREGRSSISGVAHLIDLAKRGESIPRSLAYAVLSVQEARLAEFCALFGVEMDSAKAREGRFAALRAANTRVAHLEQQIGGTAPAAATQLALQALTEKLQNWWRTDGFGYVSEVNFGGYGAEVKFSCSLVGGRPLLGSSTPVSASNFHAEWLARLSQRGFQLVRTRGLRDRAALLDCAHNQATVAALVKAALPSSQFVSSRSVYSGAGGDERVPLLRDTVFIVRDLGDLAALPAPTLS